MLYRNRRKKCFYLMFFPLSFVIFAGFPSVTFGESIEVTDYIGQQLEETAKTLQLGSAIWSMGVTAAGNESLYLGSTDAADGLIDRIILHETNAEYSLYEITSETSFEEAQQTILQKGFEPLDETSRFYFDGDSTCISLENTEDGLNIELGKVYLLSNKDAVELWGYFGKTVKEIQEALPELKVTTVGDKVELKAEGILMEAEPNKDDLAKSKVTRIEISGTQRRYCLYGMFPMDEAERGSDLGFSRGGSGEFIDMMGHVLYLGNSRDEEDPRIELY